MKWGKVEKAVDNFWATPKTDSNNRLVINLVKNSANSNLNLPSVFDIKPISNLEKS